MKLGEFTLSKRTRARAYSAPPRGRPRPGEISDKIKNAQLARARVRMPYTDTVWQEFTRTVLYLALALNYSLYEYQMNIF